MTNHDIWVFVQTDENGVKKGSLELLGKGREIAEKLGGTLTAVAVGADNREAVRMAGLYGAARVISVTGPEYAKFSADAYGAAFTALIRKYDPEAILLGGDNHCKDLGGKLSTRFRTGLVSECTDVLVEEGGKLAWGRPAFSGKLQTKITMETRPQLGSIGAGIFASGAPDPANSPEVIEENIPTPAEAIRTKILEVVADAALAEDSLDNAQIIVAGGAGLGSAEGFKPLYELAAVLGGSVGASKIAVDNKWIDVDRQVGITGHVVSPRIYIACGISGANAHTAGMKNAGVIIAVNSDPAAPIFNIANYALVGDLFEIVPALTEEIRKVKG
ncbi:MAG: electron transfer flavoprotein subunit alpha/FixB family protein [Fusobacteriaceae bacterium]|jgi:electron transfer flavoprotein alpha subunit|nr:electron transfer flavoprotein subunit alpha/FixB family protein [Fusobacteriaceae bacterium]